MAAWHAARGARGLAVVLTGTDLYSDLATDDHDARRSVKLAASLVVLQERGVHGDARGDYLRLCPDVLTTDAELVAAAEIHAAVRADRNI